VLYAYHSDINCILVLTRSGINYEGHCSGTSREIILAAVVDAIMVAPMGVEEGIPLTH